MDLLLVLFRGFYHHPIQMKKSAKNVRDWRWDEMQWKKHTLIMSSSSNAGAESSPAEDSLDILGKTKQNKINKVCDYHNHNVTNV
jgi:hypothetical protein